jgi:hypothetical protein
MDRDNGLPGPSSPALASRDVHCHAEGMFVITGADAAASRAIFNEEGELSAAIELRRRFPGVVDNAKARACASPTCAESGVWFRQIKGLSEKSETRLGPSSKSWPAFNPTTSSYRPQRTAYRDFAFRKRDPRIFNRIRL